MPLIAPKALQGLYFFCEPLAEGSFGVLYVAIHAITRQKVAVKILDKRKLGSDAYRVRSEIEALKQLNHKYIYKLYQVVETQSYFYLVVEYLPGGELFDYILQKEHLSEVEARVIFRQIVSAIGYIHSKGFAHRDLKPSNDVTMLNTFCGSFAYAAPEVLANREYSGSAADLWSLGVILYALLCGCLPFDPTKPEELPQKIGKGVFAVPDSLSKSSRHLLSQLMCVDPKKRIKIDELRRHPWIVEGFMGHPVDLDEEKVPMSPLNMHIVGEITAYTRIPKVEIARMLQKRSYDYLMATYMIMESALEEEDVFIRLQRRNQPIGQHMVSTTYSSTSTSRPAQDHRISTTIPTSTPAHSSKPLDQSAGITPAPVIFRLPLTENSSHNVIMDNMDCDHRVLPNSVSLNTPKINQLDFEGRSPADSSHSYEMEPHPNENRYPIVPIESDNYTSSAHQKEKFNFVKRMPIRGQDGCEARDLPALSPSRSIDSQLAYLTQEMYGANLIDKVLPVSVSDRYDNELPALFSTISSNLKHEIGSLHSNPGIMADDISQSSNEDGGISAPGPSNGWRRFGRLRNALTPKKPMTDGRVVVDRIRKTRHLNNVLLIRKDLSPGQVFDRIASALRQQSIRFTLKGSGFLCIFANDWGKTVLSFELELVYVSARAVEAASSSIKRRLTLKPRSHGSKSPARFIKPNPTSQECPPSATNSSKSSGVSNHSTNQTGSDLPLPTNHLLGVKMKRIRGDSFMYTSLCRTILDCADIRQPS